MSCNLLSLKRCHNPFDYIMIACVVVGKSSRSIYSRENVWIIWSLDLVNKDDLSNAHLRVKVFFFFVVESLSNRRVQVCNCLLGSRPLQVSIKSKVTGRGGMIYSNEARHSFRGSVLDPSEPFI